MGLFQKRVIMFYCCFECLIDLFCSVFECMLFSEVLCFYVYFLCQVWLVFLVLLVVGLIVVLIEVVLFSYFGCIVDFVQSMFSVEFFCVYVNELIWMVVVVLVLCLLFNVLYDMLVYQSINLSMINLICWQNYCYVFKQSFGFFQNDFVGCIVQCIMQIGNLLCDLVVQVVDVFWYVLIYIVSVLVLFVEVDWCLMIFLVLWVFVYVGVFVYFVFQVKCCLVEVLDLCLKLMGWIVDGYINIIMLKLFVYICQEEDYVCEVIGDQIFKL